MDVEKKEFTIEDEEVWTEDLRIAKAMLKKQVEKAQGILSGIDFEDPWSVFRATFEVDNQKMNKALHAYLKVSHRLSALKKAKMIAEINQDIDIGLIEFNGEYSGDDGCKVWLDHDNQRVMVVTD